MTRPSQLMNYRVVGLQMPLFWPDKPALWFTHVERQFTQNSITQDLDKFNYIISQLDQNVAAEVEDVINNPPSKNRYEKLKGELIHRLTNLQEDRLRRLLMLEEMGNRTPSQFLKHLRTMAGKKNSTDSFLKPIWASRFPPSIQEIIHSYNDLLLVNIAQRIDQLYRKSERPNVNKLTQQIAVLTTNAQEYSYRDSTRHSPLLPHCYQSKYRSSLRARSWNPYKNNHANFSRKYQ